MTDVLEKMARAIDPAAWSMKDAGMSDAHWEMLCNLSIPKARAALRAALEDMREPSEGMLVTGTTAIYQHYSMDELETAYQAMLSQYAKENLGE